MAILRNLAEFSVAEILQLLALQQKSGVLSLTDGRDQSQVLFFEHGRILAAADRRQDGRHTFLAYLMNNMLLTQDQLESVEDICRATGQDLFTVMVTSGVVGRDRMLEEMRRKTQRIIDDVVEWRNGTYEFSGDEKSLPRQGITLKLSPEELLLESMRRNDELLTLNRDFLEVLRPLYLELHTWAKYELAKKYGQPVPDRIPAHWIPNRWAPEWNGMVATPELAAA